MSDPNQQKDLHDELKTHFSNNSLIDVEKAGDDNYRVTYDIRGLTKENDTVNIGSKHVILLTIPFGFPLFAPTCQAISPIFHPDFTPENIFIGEFWNSDKTVSQLIEYVGEMIQGIHFSTESPLNKEASLWYNKNNSDFPIPQEKSNVAEEKNNNLDQNIDFASLALDSKDTVSDDEFDDQHLIELLQEKNFYQLDKALKDIPTNINFSRREELTTQTEEALYSAENLLKKAISHENKLEYTQACEVYKQAKNEVTDLFGVDENISRLQKIITTDALITPTENKEDTETSKTSKSKVPSISIKVSPKYIIALGILLFGVLILKGYESYCVAQNAQLLLDKCHQEIDKGDYRSAKYSCEGVTRIDNDSNPIFSFLTSGISEKAQKTLASERFTKGLSGKILVNGSWTDKNKKKNLSPFQSLIKDAEKHLKNRDLELAKSTINKATILAESEEDKELAAKTSALISFKSLSDNASIIYKEKGCEGAIPVLIETQKEGALLSNELQKILLPPINSLLTECSFKQLINEGNALYNSADWQKAIPIFHDALLKLEDSSINTKLSAAEIKEKISKSKIYLAIDNANQHFSAGEWQQAIDTYNQAIEELQNENNHQINISKIQRIALEAEINQAQENAKIAAKKHQFNSAINEYNKISSLIKNSSFENDQELTKILKKVPHSIQDLKSKRFIEGKRQELLKKHTTLFTTNYPASSAETLSNQRVLFLDHIGSTFTYKLLATDRSSGSAMTLVIFYAYNSKTGKWNFADTRE